MDVHAWTINEVEDMQRMIDLGVDGIITDYPDRLLDVLIALQNSPSRAEFLAGFADGVSTGISPLRHKPG